MTTRRTTEASEGFATALRGRLGKFGLHVNEAKTRLIEFGRFAANHLARQNQRPATFDFLGFTHSGGRTRTGGGQGEPSDRGDAVAAGHHSGDGVVSGASAPLRPGPVAVRVQCASGALPVLRAHGEHCQPEELPGGAPAGVAEVVGPSQPAGADVVGALWAAAVAPSLAGGVGAALRVPEGLTVNLSLKSRVREIRSHGSAGA
jgi:hypothetical protein